MIEWDDTRDRDLLRQLTAYKARARGRRLKELALLGLLAERSGCRVVTDPQGVARLEGLVMPMFVGGGAKEAKPEATNLEPDAERQLSEAHEAGLHALLGNVVGF